MTALIGEAQTSQTTYAPAHKYLVDRVDPELWERITYQISESPLVEALGDDAPSNLSDRILDMTVAFLWCAARASDKSQEPLTSIEDGPLYLALPPSIDEGWHWFILYMEGYSDFCQTQLGRIIWHKPFHPVLDKDKFGSLAEGRARTLAVMEELGFAVDTEVWHLSAYEPGGSGYEDDTCFKSSTTLYTTISNNQLR